MSAVRDGALVGALTLEVAPAAWACGEALRETTERVQNARLQRWFGWDGAGDSLWAQSLRRMLDSREMGSDLAGIAGAVRADTDLRRHDHATFGELPPPDDETAAGT